MVSEDSGIFRPFLLIVRTKWFFTLKINFKVPLDTRIFQHIARFVFESRLSKAATFLRPPFTGASVQSFALRLTSPLNLPAPGRRQTLYIDFMSLQSPVFLLNSRLSHFSAASSGLQE